MVNRNVKFKKSQCSLTISDKDRPAIMPRLEHLFLKHDLRDELLGRPVDQVSHGKWCCASTDNGEFPHLVTHGFCYLWPPL